jgi:hypothetical protein
MVTPTPTVAKIAPPPTNPLEAPDSVGKRMATDKLTQLISVGEQAQTEIIQKMLAMSITDKLVDPRLMLIEESNKGLAVRYPVGTPDVVEIDDNALGQLCKTARIPKTYMNELLTGCVGMSEPIRQHLACYLLNTHYQRGVFTDKRGNPTKFLHRIVGKSLYGFLSRNYNRKLGTSAMLRPFIEQCYANGARPVDAQCNPIRAVLKCVQPIIYEPVPGEFIAFGATYTNSDFGKGSLLVHGTLLRISSGTSAVLESRLKKIHLGAVISEEEIELSEETLAKESETHISAVKDMVTDVFSETSITRSLKLVELSITRKLSWNQVLGQVKELLHQDEVSSMHEMLLGTKGGIVDLPPVTVNDKGDPEANAWWTAAALGVIASRVEDVDRRAGIQELAGRVLKKEKE